MQWNLIQTVLNLLFLPLAVSQRYFCDMQNSICQPCFTNCNRYAYMTYSTARRCLDSSTCVLAFDFPPEGNSWPLSYKDAYVNHVYDTTKTTVAPTTAATTASFFPEPPQPPPLIRLQNGGDDDTPIYKTTKYPFPPKPPSVSHRDYVFYCTYIGICMPCRPGLTCPSDRTPFPTLTECQAHGICRNGPIVRPPGPPGGPFPVLK